MRIVAGGVDVDELCSRFVAAVRHGDRPAVDEIGHTLYVKHGLTMSDLWRLVNEADRRSHSRENNPLTEREVSILVLVAQGRNNAEIARRLHLAEGTVKTYLVRIYTKVGTRDRTEAAVTAVSRGWIDVTQYLGDTVPLTEQDETG